MYRSKGQGHVFNAWSQLSGKQKTELIEQTKHFDVEQINDLYQEIVIQQKATIGEQVDSFELVEPENVGSKKTMTGTTRQSLHA